jgi:hypothetical protein
MPALTESEWAGCGAEYLKIRWVDQEWAKQGRLSPGRSYRIAQRHLPRVPDKIIPSCGLTLGRIGAEGNSECYMPMAW